MIRRKCLIFGCVLVVGLGLSQAGGADQPKANTSITRLIEEMKDRDAKVRQKAAQALRVLGLRGKPAEAVLIGALKDEDAAVRYAAIQALKEIGPDPKAAMQPLIEFVQEVKQNER